MSDSKCPSRDELVQFDSASLAENEDARMAQHCSECSQCQNIIMEIEQEKIGRFHVALESNRESQIHGVDPFPSQIGPYHIRGLIGKGGMGIVLLAEQQKPILRQVAIKLVKLGMDTNEVLARFDMERQSLAVMDHPNIARVYDAGSTSDGRPYFVMEYVVGSDIIAYCDKHRMGIKERIELFIQVCNGIQHAHQKGIIHRDVKPSNVLVSDIAERPIPKIIDFGIAKATNQQSAGTTFSTSAGSVIGTLEYMSPEQADLTNQEIDTRSDVYSLGVVLYELLTGKRPFELQAETEIDLINIQQTICEHEPVTPSACIKTAEAPDKRIQDRQTNQRALVRRLRGDLDWIVMQSIEKDPDRRYASVNSLATDLQRHLNDQPVDAGPPSRSYRIKKFVKRHRGLVSSGAAVFLTLVVGIVVATFLAMGQRTERMKAARQSQMSEEMFQFMTNEILAQASPNYEADRDITMLEVLSRATATLESDSDIDPELRARLLTEVGKLYRQLGQYSKSRDLFSQSYAVASSSLGDRHHVSMTALDQLGLAYMWMDDYERAEEFLRKADRLQREVLGPEHEDTVHTYAKIGDLCASLNRLDEAEKITREVLETRRRLWGDSYEFTPVSLNGLGLIYLRQEKPGKALEVLEEARRIGTEQQGADHPYVLTYAFNCALAYRDLGDLDSGQRIANETWRRSKKRLSPNDPSTLSSAWLVGSLLTKRGYHADSLKILERTLDEFDKLDYEDTRLQVRLLSDCGICLMKLERYEEAEQKLNSAHRLNLESHGSDDERSQESAQLLQLLRQEQNQSN